MSKYLFFILVAISITLIPGCEIGTNPLVLDSSIRADSIKVDFPIALPGSLPLSSKIINLGELKDVAGGNIEKVTFYNMTLLITDDQIDAEKVTGSLKIDGNQIVSFTDVPTSAFHSERSIFDTTGINFHISSAGLGYLLKKIKDPTPQIVTLQSFLGPTSTPLKFTLWVKIYGQVTSKK
jgi:hypothetical protein